MGKKVIYYGILAAVLMLIGLSLHLTLCEHPNQQGFSLWNFSAHFLIWSSVFFAVIAIINIKKVEVVAREYLITDANEIGIDATIKELNFMIVVTRLMKVMSSINFIATCTILFQFLIAYLFYRYTGNFSIFYVGLIVSFLGLKFMVKRCWGAQLEADYYRLSIDLYVFKEIRARKKTEIKNNLL